MKNLFSKFNNSESLKNYDIKTLSLIFNKIINLNDTELDSSSIFNQESLYSPNDNITLDEYNKHFNKLAFFLKRYSASTSTKPLTIVEMFFACINFKRKEESPDFNIGNMKKNNDKLKEYFDSELFLESKNLTKTR